MLNYNIYSTPLGRLTIADNGAALTHVLFSVAAPSLEAQLKKTPLQTEAARQLTEYAQGARREFTLPLAPSGSSFDKAVWQMLTKILFGTLSCYGDIARRLEMPHAARAVGGAVGRNPIAVIIPCHRIIGRDGSLTGFSGGLDKKMNLLTIEGWRFRPDNRGRKAAFKIVNREDL